MKRIASFGGSLAILFLLVGAGCDNTSPTNNQDVNTTTDTVPTTEQSGTLDTVQENSFALQASAVGNNQVAFEWTLESSMAEPKQFILLRDSEKKPEMDGKTFWFRQDGSHRSATWVDVPSGIQSFRICTSEDGTTCLIYSDSVSVDVLSGNVSNPTTEKTNNTLKEDTKPADTMNNDNAMDTKDESSTTTDDNKTKEDTTSTENTTSTDDTMKMEETTTTEQMSTSTDEHMTTEKTTTSTETMTTTTEEETTTNPTTEETSTSTNS